MTYKQHIRWWLYILELEGGKWYVGITSKSLEERYDEHKLGRRAAYWTMKYKPVKIELVEDLGVVSREHAEKYENTITRQLIKERGLNNVRGGDLRDTDDYIRRFGWYWNKNDWATITYIIFLNLLILWFVMDRYGWDLGMFALYVVAAIIVLFVVSKFQK